MYVSWAYLYKYVEVYVKPICMYVRRCEHIDVNMYK